MIDFGTIITELEEHNQELDRVCRRLFDLHSKVVENEFPTQEKYAVAAKIIYIRSRITNILVDIKDLFEDLPESDTDCIDLEIDEEHEDITNTIRGEIKRDNDLLPSLVDEIVLARDNDFPLSFITRYKDLVFKLLEFCATPDLALFPKIFRDIPRRELFDGGR